MLEDTHAHDVDIDFFDQNGYLIVRNVLNDESIAALIGAGDGLIHIDFDLINPMIDAGQVVDIELEPGDVLIFQNLLFHQGSVNHSGKLRWNADFRYQDACQPTLTSVNGHLIRSRAHLEQIASSREEWACLPWSYTKNEPTSCTYRRHCISGVCQIVGMTLPPQTGIYAPVM